MPRAWLWQSAGAFFVSETYLNRQQIAEKLSGSTDTVDRMIERGYLPKPALKLSPGRSGSYRWRASEVEAALERLHEMTRGQP
jgi:predicted DNA-binding transcriptional regulator AlpA